MKTKLTLKIGLNLLIGAIALASLCASLSYADNDLPTIDPSKVPDNVMITFDKANPTDSVNTRMIINAPDKTIMDFSSFNISKDYSVQVILPTYENGSLASFLARDVGGSASNINGYLDCKGLFMLVNTNGINVGPDANIDVGSLVLSTRNITNTNFVDANYIFEKQLGQQTDRLLINRGNITISKGGFGVLIAGAIENQGIIVCPLGTIALAGGDHVRFDIANNGMLSIAIDKETASKVLDYNNNPVTAQISNTGTLEANGGTVILKAEALPGLFEKAINLEGYVRADRLEERDGRILLEAANITGSATLSSPYIEVYKTSGDIVVSNVEKVDSLITIEGDGLKVTYMVTSDFTLKSDNAIDTTPGAIMQGNSLNLIARRFGDVASPLTIDAAKLHITRTIGDIDITESTGLGTSILICGPPIDGFGQIIYNKSTDLQLETLSGGIFLSGNSSIEARNLTIERSTFNAGNGTIILSGNFTVTNGGVFNADTSTVIFIDSSIVSYIIGSSTFYNLTVTTPGKQIVFESGSMTTISGFLTIEGAPGNNVSLRSSLTGEGNEFDIWINGVQDAQGNLYCDYITVTGSDAYGPLTPIPAKHDNVVGRNNKDWDATFTSAIAGDWNLGATWGTVGNVEGINYPGPNDTAIIGHTVTVTTDQSVTDITINTGGTLSVASTKTLSLGTYSNLIIEEGAILNGAGTIYHAAGGGGGFYGINLTNNGTIDIANFNYAMTSYGVIIYDIPATTYGVNTATNVSITGTNYGFSLTFEINTGTLKVKGNLSLIQTGGGGPVILTNSLNSNIEIGGDLTKSGNISYTNGTETITFNGTGIQTITPSGNFYNLTINKTSGYVSLAGATTVSNTFAITNGTLDKNGQTLTATYSGEALDRTDVALDKEILFTNYLTLARAGTYISDDGDISVIDATLTVGTLDLSTYTDTLTSTGTITINGGTLTATNGDITASSVTLSSGILTAPGSGKSFTVSGNWTNNDGTFTPGTGTVTFNGTADQAINGTATSQTFYNLIVNNLTPGKTLSVSGSTTTLTTQDLTETTGNFTPPATLNINGNLLLTLSTFTAGTNTNISGNWTHNGGIFTPGLNTVTFNGTLDQAINGTAASQTFYNLIVNLTATKTLTVSGSTTTLTVQDLTETTGNFTAPATLNINGNLTLTAGTFTAGANTNIAGNWTNNGGTFTAGFNTVTLNGTAIGKTINPGTSHFYNLTFNGSGGVWSPLTNTVYVDSILTMTAGTFDNYNGSADVQVVGNVAGTAGVISFTTNTFTQRTSAGVRSFGTTSGDTNWTLNNLNFENSSITSKSIVPGSGGTGQIIINGTLTIGNASDSNNITLNNSSRNRIFDINNFTITSKGAFIASSTALFTVSGGWANSGTFTAGTGAVTLDGSGSQAISGNNTFSTVTISTRVSGTVSFAGSDTITTLTVNGPGGYNVSIAGAATTITNSFAPANGGTLTLGAALGTQTYNGGIDTTGVGGVVTLNGTIKTSNDALTLGAVTLGSNTILDTDATTTTGDITIGAVTGGGFTLNIETGSGVANADVNGTSISNVTTLTLANIGGTAIFTGAVTVTAISADNTVVNLSLTGNGNTSTNAFAPTNTGTLTLGAALGTQTYNGGIDTTGVGGVVTLNGTIKTSNDALTLGAVTLGSNTILDTDATTTTGDITIGAVTGGGFTLNIETGSGVANADVNGTSISNVTTLTLANIGGTAAFTGVVNLTADASIGAGVTLNIGAQNLTVPGTLTNSGTIITSGNGSNLIIASTDFGNVTFTANASQLPAKTYLTLTFGNGGTMLGDITVTNLTITAGTFNANGKDISISGNWTNDVGASGFTAGTGTVTFTNSGTISGDTTFNNLTCTTGGKTLTFANGSTQTINGIMTLKGSVGNLLTLQSDSSGTKWNIDPKLTVNVDYLDVIDSNNMADAIYTPTSIVTRCTNWYGTARPVPPVPQPVNPSYATYETTVIANTVEQNITNVIQYNEGSIARINSFIDGMKQHSIELPYGQAMSIVMRGGRTYLI